MRVWNFGCGTVRPEKAIYGVKPKYVTSTDVWVNEPVKPVEPHLSKHAGRSTEMVFIGCERTSGTNAYRFYDPHDYYLRSNPHPPGH